MPGRVIDIFDSSNERGLFGRVRSGAGLEWGLAIEVVSSRACGARNQHDELCGAMRFCTRCIAYALFPSCTH